MTTFAADVRQIPETAWLGEKYYTLDPVDVAVFKTKCPVCDDTVYIL